MQERFLLNANYFDRHKLLLRAFRHIQIPTDMHKQEFSELVFVTGGRGTYRTGPGFTSYISTGDVLIVPAGGRHIYVETEDLEIVCFLFATLPLPLLDLHSLPSFRSLFGKSAAYYERAKKDYPIIHPPAEIFARLEKLLDDFLYVQNVKGGGMDCAKLGIFMALTGILCDCVEMEAGRIEKEIHSLEVNDMNAFMLGNIHRNISLQEMAEHCSMSVSTLLRHFKKTYGTTPVKYINKLRLELAAELLASTYLRVSEVADRCGFSSASHFILQFRRKYGITPDSFRDSAGKESQRE